MAEHTQARQRLPAHRRTPPLPCRVIVCGCAGLKDAEECIKLAPEFAKGYSRKGHLQYFMKVGALDRMGGAGIDRGVGGSAGASYCVLSWDLGVHAPCMLCGCKLQPVACTTAAAAAVAPPPPCTRMAAAAHANHMAARGTKGAHSKCTTPHAHDCTHACRTPAACRRAPPVALPAAAQASADMALRSPATPFLCSQCLLPAANHPAPCSSPPPLPTCPPLPPAASHPLALPPQEYDKALCASSALRPASHPSPLLPTTRLPAQEYDKAIETYQAGLARDPENSELKEGLARCVQAINKVERGRGGWAGLWICRRRWRAIGRCGWLGWLLLLAWLALWAAGCCLCGRCCWGPGSRGRAAGWEQKGAGQPAAHARHAPRFA